MTIRYQRVGLKIERVREDHPPAPPTAEALEQALVGLFADMATAEATIAAVRARVRLLVADAWARQQTRARLAPTRAPVAPPALGVLGRHVTRARFLAHRVSQRELAGALGLHRSQVAEAERGVRYVPEKLGRWAMRVLRQHGEWPPSDASEPAGPAEEVAE